MHKAWFFIVYMSSFHEQQGMQGLGEGICSGRQDREGVLCSGDSRSTGESLKGVSLVPCSPVGDQCGGSCGPHQAHLEAG